MRFRIAFTTLLLVSTICAALVSAQETTNPVNPFNDPPPRSGGVSASISDEPEAAEERTGFSLPKLTLPKLPKPTLPKLALPKLKMPQLPKWKKETTSTARRPVEKPSTLEKLNNSTKNMFAKTRDTLLPWTVKDDLPTVRNATGSRSTTGFTRTRVASNRGSSSSESSGEKKTLFSSWLSNGDEPEEKPIRTTTDFLKQDRPQFDR